MIRDASGTALNHGTSPATEFSEHIHDARDGQTAVRQKKNAGEKSDEGTKRDLDIGVEPTG